MAKFQPQIEKDGKHIYAYILTVNDKIYKTLCFNFRALPEQMSYNKCYIAQTAKVFKKTAGVLVYEYGWNEEGEGMWRYCGACETTFNRISEASMYYGKNELPNMTPTGFYA